MEATRFKNWWLILIKGIVLIILAFVIFRHPVETLVGITLYMGIGLLLTGIVLIIAAIAARNVLENWGWRLAEGILDVFIGMMLLANPGVTAVIIPFLIGFWVAFYGILLFADAFGSKKAGFGNWWLELIAGIVTVIMGYVIAFHPVISILAITTFIGISLLIVGLFNVVLSLDIRKVNKNQTAMV